MKHITTFRNTLKNNRLRFSIALLLLSVLFTPSRAADYYWVNGSGNWSDYGAHWATTSGGSIFHTTIPTLNDDVYFDANSFTATGQQVLIDNTFIYCHNMDWTGALFSPMVNGLGNTMHIYGSLNLIPAMSWSVKRIDFKGAGSSFTLAQAGHLLDTLYFNGTGSFAFTETTVAKSIYIYDGTFTTAGFDITSNKFIIGTPGATVNADLSNSDINISDVFKSYDGTLNVTSTSCNLNFVNAIVPKMYLWASGQTFNNISTSSNTEVIGSLNCQQITAAGTFYINTNWASVTCTDASFSGNTTLDCNLTATSVTMNTPGSFIKLRTLNLSGNFIANGICGSPIQISPIDFLAQGTINKASGTVNVDYTNITSVQATGGAVYNATNSVDNGNNSGWNFSAPAPRILYWVGGTGDWHDTAHWSLTSGGSGGNCLPASYDDVIFDANSFSQAGETVTVNGPQANCFNMDWTGVSNNPVFTTGFIYDISVHGSLALDPAMTANATAFQFAGAASGNTIFTAGDSIGTLLINGTGSWTLADPLNCASLQVYKGTFNTSNHNITTEGFSANGINNAIFIDLGTSTLYISGSYMAFAGAVTMISANASLVFNNPNGSSIFVQLSPNAQFDNVTAVTGAYFMGNLVCNNFDAQAGVHVTAVVAQTAQFAQSSTANFVSAGTVTLGSGVLSFSFDTLAVTNVFNVSSNCSSTLSLQPYTAPQAIFSMLNGSVTVDYAYIRSIEAQGSGGFAANNSWDLGNNSGWTFNSATARDLYWVGGTGNWNDVAHWSLSSGGPGGNCQPGMQDNVMFDANSFSQPGDSIYVHPTAGVYMNNLTFTSIPNGTLLYSSSGNTPMNIGGSLTMPAELDLWSVAINMTSANTGNTLTTGGNSIIDLRFSGSGDWSLQDNLTTGNFHSGNGTFMSNGHYLDLGGVNIGGSAVLDFGFSTIDVLGFWSQVGPTVIGGNATLKMNSSFLSVDLENAHFGTVLFTGDANVDSDFSCDRLWAMGNFTNINGVITAHYSNFKSHVTLPYNFIGDSIVFDNPGKLVRISTVTVNDDIAANGNSGFPIQIEGLNGTGTITKASGQICLDHVLILNITATGGAQFFAGANGVNLGGNTGWTFGPCVPLLTDVWPGDANYDLTVDNTDILNIGLAYGYTGFTRAGGSAWGAWPAADWSSQFANGANLKHADTDGSGTVDIDDTLAVSQNYGLSHPPRLMQVSPSQLPSPELYVVTNPDTAALSDTVEVEIYLGTSTLAVDSIYGIAFTINFDSTLISSSYLSVDYTGCWMGTSQVDLIGFDKNFLSQGYVDMALVRTDQQNVNGFGLLTRLGIVIVDNVGAKVTMPVTLSNITAITASEYLLTIATASDSIVIDTAATVGINEPVTFTASFHPNPVNDLLYVNSGDVKLKGYEIYNISGNLVQQNADVPSAFTIDTREMSQGVYFVKLISENSVMVRRIEILRN